MEASSAARENAAAQLEQVAGEFGWTVFPTPTGQPDTTVWLASRDDRRATVTIVEMPEGRVQVDIDPSAHASDPAARSGRITVELDDASSPDTTGMFRRMWVAASLA